ncbi:MAG: isochorismatase family protein [Pirellulales bacterium]
MSERPVEKKIEAPLPRSPELMNAGETGLLVVDAQEKLLQVIPRRAEIVWNIRRLLDAAAALGVQTAATEQYPEKLGATAPDLRQRLDDIPDKLSFSACACSSIFDAWRAAGLYRVLLTGIETHVCVQQTALDLAADSWMVYLAVDAVGSRRDIDHETALRRLESAGVILTSTEAAMFEWCRVAGSPEFKQISALAKETSPTK